jgi:hypothetical protein
MGTSKKGFAPPLSTDSALLVSARLLKTVQQFNPISHDFK